LARRLLSLVLWHQMNDAERRRMAQEKMDRKARKTMAADPNSPLPVCAVCREEISPRDPVVTSEDGSSEPTPVHVRCWRLPSPAPAVFEEAPMPPLGTIGARPGGRLKPCSWATRPQPP